MKSNTFAIRFPVIAAALHVALAFCAAAESPVAVPAVTATSHGRIMDDAWLARIRAEAQQKHPTVEAARAKLAAASAGVRAVRLWEDPMASFSLTAARRSMRMDNGDIGIGFEQQLPKAGLYGAMKTKAEAEQRAQAAGVLAAQAELGLETANAALELALADEAIALETQQVEWVQQMSANARERAKDPASSAAEALRLESELARERQNLAAMERERQQRARQLNILLGRPASQSWARLSLPDIAAAPELSTLLGRLASANPRMQVLQHMAAVANAETGIARRERQPGVTIGIDTNTYSGGDFRDATFGVKVTLPWFNERVYRANEERAAALAGAARSDLAAAERELQSQAIAASTSARNGAQQAAAYSAEIIPAATRAAEAVANAWLSSKATLLEVLEARRSLLTSRLEEKRFLAAHRAALETLRALAPHSKN